MGFRMPKIRAMSIGVVDFLLDPAKSLQYECFSNIRYVSHVHNFFIHDEEIDDDEIWSQSRSRRIQRILCCHKFMFREGGLSTFWLRVHDN